MQSAIFISFVLSFLLPKSVNLIIDVVRRFFNKSDRSFLPPINSFFQDIENYGLYVYDFKGQLINSGTIKQGTEERQSELSLTLWPFKNDDDSKTYSGLIAKLIDVNQVMSFEEYVDYDKKYHFVKVRPRD